ncbi:hypothetical protein ACIG3E_21890 [Streptomyces sp. NPDC053474]|uniref:hypothetical protein n=1 Tax=Streptomyces sp. NPDC053474 TaxID=3365704 RepID=UPI0037CF314B
MTSTSRRQSGPPHLGLSIGDYLARLVQGDASGLRARAVDAPPGVMFLEAAGITVKPTREHAVALKDLHCPASLGGSTANLRALLVSSHAPQRRAVRPVPLLFSRPRTARVDRRRRRACGTWRPGPGTEYAQVIEVWPLPWKAAAPLAVPASTGA